MNYNKLFFPLIFLIMLASMVSAQGFPNIVSGKVMIDGIPMADLNPVITNLVTGKVFETTTGNNGVYTANIYDLSYRGNDISIKVCTGNPECSKTVFMKPGVPMKINFNFGNGVACSTSFFWKGTTIAGIVFIFLFGAGAAYQTGQKNKVLKSWAREMLQLAENVSLGKLRDIKEEGELTEEFKSAALEYELANKKRGRILNFLRE